MSNVETYVVRGNLTSVIQQLVETYNKSNGWAINRVVASPISPSVYLERSVKQADDKEETVTATKAPTAKAKKAVVKGDATASKEQEKPSVGAVEPLLTKEIVEV